MYRIMLVDDEPLILAGITSLINWEDHACTIVGRATNGQQALEQIIELQPDIIITDIKMPVMNGLELIAKCKEEKLDFSFVVLTNLEEFELAKKALTLGASEYLVKINLTEESLVNSLNKAKQHFDQITACNTNRMVNSFIEAGKEEITKTFFKKLLLSSQRYATIDDVVLPDETDKLNTFTEHEKQIAERFVSPLLIMLNISYSNAEYIKEDKQDDIKKIAAHASGIISEMLGRFFKNSSILEWEQWKFLLVVSTEGIENLTDVLKSFCQKVNTVLKTYFEITAAFGISEIAKDAYQLPELIDQTITAIDYYYYYPSSPIIFYSEKCRKKEHNDNFDISFLKKELNIALQQNDSQKVSDIFNQLIDLFSTYTPRKRQAINACINLYSFFESYENGYMDALPSTITVMEHLNQFSCLNDIIEYLKYFRTNICNIIDSKKNSKIDKIIELTKKYVNNHYTEKLTLSSVSEALNFSSGYLSSSFKKHTGSNFSDYISYVKIEKAKELINTHNYLMYEISDMLGFDNPYYFSKVFKKVTGMSPREYEISIINQK
ncbi:response regulator transcription factor [Anaerocolumna sp.]|uniref:response regulator transcription factor n=1 Tax=Anaerocolumna sp. TaxID=2041569 RepID=UPI0028AC6C3C|nr:response regulator [Anaerocolumna sp.]